MNRAIALPKQALKAVPNPCPDKEAGVALLSFSERGPRLAVRPCTHNDTCWQVYFDTNRGIADTLSRNGFPVPRIAVQFAQTCN